MADQINEHVLVLEAERDRLRNAVQHLSSSNRQLKQALEEDGPDAEYQEAIGENIVVIAKYHGQIALLEKDIKAAREAQPCADTTTR
ncbi:hypothetical protein WJX72_007716 [[Myrmecia] bisecta]|uniref:Uncharacterized protein n=1 Tax=[Myrmecia] bisecta TaxID=41462 RepID=A0AAW1P0Z7_9CHLO